MADAEAYRQSAEDPVSRHLNQMMGAHYLSTTRLMTVVVALLAIVGVLTLIAVIRWRRRIGRVRFTAP